MALNDMVVGIAAIGYAGVLQHKGTCCIVEGKMPNSGVVSMDLIHIDLSECPKLL